MQPMGIQSFKTLVFRSQTLSRLAREDLTWWLNHIHEQNRVIHGEHPSITITTDRSDFAWSGSREAQHTGGPQSYQESLQKINVREPYAIFLTLKTLCKAVKDHHIGVMCDKTMAVSYIYKNGGKIKELYQPETYGYGQLTGTSGYQLSICLVP